MAGGSVAVPVEVYTGTVFVLEAVTVPLPCGVVELTEVSVGKSSGTAETWGTTVMVGTGVERLICMEDILSNGLPVPSRS